MKAGQDHLHYVLKDIEKRIMMSNTIAFPPMWNIPYRRNEFFTGRGDVLTHLHQALQADNTVALTQPQSISGLGGIGKTQTAIEYAYRYHSAYRAILWARADSYGVLLSEFVRIAFLLNLPEKDEQDQNLVVEAVMRWLHIHTHWLLILDNVEDIELAAPFIPMTGRGHVLLTTRAQGLGGIAQRVQVEKMDAYVGAWFLLRRAGFIASQASFDAANDDDCIHAMEISRVMDGLPLALDQAGAYIKEVPCSLSDYLDLYRLRSAVLLNVRHNSVADYPDSVATTWSLSFEKVALANPASAGLLNLCTFLYPDAIAEEIITDGAPYLGSLLQSIAVDQIQLDNAFKEILKFSLLYREPDTRTFSMHRLVQAVLKDKMQEDVQQQWAERTVRAVNNTFPEVKFANWSLCDRCILHAQICATHIKQWNMVFPEAALLLNEAGGYLDERGQYSAAELLHQQALPIWEKTVGSEHFHTARAISHLGVLYNKQGKYEQAEPLLLHALAIRERLLGVEHPDTATSLNNLAGLYDFQGRYTEAEQLLLRALTIRKRVQGLEHSDTANGINNLAFLYDRQGKYEQAEPLYRQALAICEQTLGPEHPNTMVCLNNLAALYERQGNYEQAEQYYERMLTVLEKVLGSEHPDVARCLSNLAGLYDQQEKHEQSEPLYQRALAINEQTLGSEHPSTLTILNNLAGLYYMQNSYERAEVIMQRTQAILENVLGPEHPDLATTLHNLALLNYTQEKYEQAESLLLRALAIRELVLGSEHPATLLSLDHLVAIYEYQDRYEQAAQLYARILAIRENRQGSEHPDLVAVLENYASLLRRMGKENEAIQLEMRAQAIQISHPDKSS
jgi:tetratricopeptide (TPR) repeat protein